MTTAALSDDDETIMALLRDMMGVFEEDDTVSAMMRGIMRSGIFEEEPV